MEFAGQGIVVGRDYANIAIDPAGRNCIDYHILDISEVCDEEIGFGFRFSGVSNGGGSHGGADCKSERRG